MEKADIANYRGLLARLGDAPAWLLSALVHLGLLLIFASAVYSTGMREPEIEIVSTIEEPRLDQYAFEQATTLEELGNKSPLNTLSPSQAMAATVQADPSQRLDERLKAKFEIKEPTPRNMIVAPSQLQLTSIFNVSGTTENTGGVEGAIDRLTNEIAASLRENETTVIWLFDASRSLRDRREKIADRFEGIYAQLDKLGVLSEDRLLTVVAAYAQRTALLTPEPTSNTTVAAKAVREIPNPDSGTENVLTALMQVTKKFLPQRTRDGRNVMAVIVTDEKGDDFETLDASISFLKRYGIKVYCVGNAAPLGQVKEYIPWTYEDGYVERLPVDRGPESGVPQRLGLPFWGKGRPKSLSSGYGPYGLTRLVAETGGLFLLAEESSVSFDPAVMRNYAPDYRPLPVLLREIRSNPAKMALVNAARLTQSSEFRKAIPQPRLVFPASNDTELRRAITEAQKPLAVVDYKLQQVAAIMATGMKGREKLTDPRWRAAFDLAAGRTAALRARAFGYNLVLAQMKVSPKPFEKKGSNQWALEPNDKIAGGPRVENLAKTAKKLLSRVVDEHPGTPWARLAARELSTEMGWQWVEQNKLVERFGPRARDPEVARLLLAEEEEKERMRAKMTPPKKRDRPKL